MRLPRFLRALLQPYYIHRPSQLLKRIWREWLLSSHAPQTATLPWGSPLQINPVEHIGRSVWLHGIHGIAVCEILWRLARPGMNVIDAGANIGIMTSLLAHRTATEGRVYAFEPHPSLYSTLAENIRRFRQIYSTMLIPLPFALSNHEGIVQLTWTDAFRKNRGLASVSKTSSDTGGIDVPCTCLDALFPTAQIDILKIDVEGHESQVLEGAQSLLTDDRIIHVLYECLDGPDSALHDRLYELGYTTFGIEETMCGPRLWNLRGLPPPPNANVSSSFLASKQPRRVVQFIAPNGWNCLTGRDAQPQ